MDWVHFVHRLCTCWDGFDRALAFGICGFEAIVGRCAAGAVGRQATLCRDDRQAPPTSLARVQPTARTAELRIVAADDRAARLAAGRQSGTTALGVRS